MYFHFRDRVEARESGAELYTYTRACFFTGYGWWTDATTERQALTRGAREWSGMTMAMGVYDLMSPGGSGRGGSQRGGSGRGGSQRGGSGRGGSQRGEYKITPPLQGSRRGSGTGDGFGSLGLSAADLQELQAGVIYLLFVSLSPSRERSK